MPLYLFLLTFAMVLPLKAQESVTLEPRFASTLTKKVKEEDLYKQNAMMQRYSLAQEGEIDVELLTPLDAASEISNAITPQGKFLKFTHQGPYETIDQTYEEIADYLDDKGLESEDYVIEEFIKRPPFFNGNEIATYIYIKVRF